MNEIKYTPKQLEIIEKTIEYISKNGIQSFSLRNIASELGIKQPTLYGHFGSKEEILRGVFNIYKDSVKSYHQSLARVKAGKTRKLRMYFIKMCELIQYRPDYMNLVTFEIFQYRELFKDDLNFLLHDLGRIIDNAPDDQENSKNLDYKWLITNIQGTLHVFLKNKLLNPEFDALSSAEVFWEKLDKLIK